MYYRAADGTQQRMSWEELHCMGPGPFEGHIEYATRAQDHPRSVRLCDTVRDMQARDGQTFHAEHVTDGKWRSDKRWTQQEDDALMLFDGSGMNFQAIGRILHRTEMATRVRYWYLRRRMKMNGKD